MKIATFAELSTSPIGTIFGIIKERDMTLICNHTQHLEALSQELSPEEKLRAQERMLYGPFFAFFAHHIRQTVQEWNE